MTTTTKPPRNRELPAIDPPLPAPASDDDLVCPRCGHEIGDSPYCAECGLHVQVEPSIPTRADWQASQEAPSTPPKPSGNERAGSPEKRSAIHFVLPLVGLLAIVAIGLAAAGLIMNRPTSNTPLLHRVRVLRSELATANHHITSQTSAISQLQASSQAGAVSNLTSQVSGLQGRVQKLLLCVPELQQEVYGLNVSTSNTNGFLTNAYLSNATIISSNCTKTLNGS